MKFMQMSSTDYLYFFVVITIYVMVFTSICIAFSHLVCWLLHTMWKILLSNDVQLDFFGFAIWVMVRAFDYT